MPDRHHSTLARWLLRFETCEPRLLLSASTPEALLLEPTVIGEVLWGTRKDDQASHTLDAGRFNVNAIYGDYGNDRLLANNQVDSAIASLVSPSPEIDLRDFANVLNGGHGKDELIGSDLPDLLISRADGREPVIAQNWDASDDPLNEINPLTNTYYADQPIEGDDLLVGGRGADLFYFQALLNAKERIIRQHIEDDGTINWSGVAGENNNVHDHWVDGLGDELIADFNRAEGDHILIGGHTTEVFRREYIDSNGDNVVDSTVLHLWSNQGTGGGAHNEDLLGTITVANVLLNANDYTTYHANYGIVDSVIEIREAIRPFVSVADDGIRPQVEKTSEYRLPDETVFLLDGEVHFTGQQDDYGHIEHRREFELADGTVSFYFTADEVSGQHALFSKDASQQLVGGHLTGFVLDGRVQVRMQSTNETLWLKSPVNSIQPDVRYHVAVSFGGEGFRLFLDGQQVGSLPDFHQGLDTNTAELVIGANIWGRSDADPLYARHEFSGTISDFVVDARQWNPSHIVNPLKPIDLGTSCDAHRHACVDTVLSRLAPLGSPLELPLTTVGEGEALNSPISPANQARSADTPLPVRNHRLDSTVRDLNRELDDVRPTL